MYLLKTIIHSPRMIVFFISFFLLFWGLPLTKVVAETSTSGVISVDTIWTVANSPYIITGSVTVASGATLTIEPGVTVKFDPDKALEIEGTLIARGTDSERITFTSSIDSPSDSDYWAYITFDQGNTPNSIPATFLGDGAGSFTDYVSGSILEYCSVEYGGSLGNRVIKSASYINHCTFSNNKKGVNVQFSERSGDSDTIYLPVKVTNSTFNGTELSVGRNSIVDGNTFINAGVSSQGGIVSNNIVRGGGISGAPSNDESCASTNYCYNLTISGNFVSGNISGSGNNGAGITLLSGGGGLNEGEGDSQTINVINNYIIGNESDGIFITESWATQGCETCYYRNITENYIADNGGYAIYANNAGVLHVSKNRIHNNVRDESQLRNEQFSPYLPIDATIYLTAGDDTFEYNTISSDSSITRGENSTVIYINHGTQTFRYNNIVRGQENYLIYVYASNDDQSVANNWWNTTNTTNLDALIYDWNDNPTKAIANYSPILSVPDTTAPPLPPSNVAIQTGPTSIALTWDANPESDIAGYKVYYDTDESGYPYANSVDIGNLTSYTLTGLSSETTYYVAISAYDAEDNESWFSNEQTIVTPESVPISLAYLTQPGGGTAGASFTTQPVVLVIDLDGNTVTSATDSVTLNITSGTGTAGSTLIGTSTVSAVNGVVTFTDLGLNQTGTGYTLTATSGSLTSTVSSAFNVSAAIPSPTPTPTFKEKITKIEYTNVPSMTLPGFIILVFMMLGILMLFLMKSEIHKNDR